MKTQFGQEWPLWMLGVAFLFELKYLILSDVNDYIIQTSQPISPFGKE